MVNTTQTVEQAFPSQFRALNELHILDPLSKVRAGPDACSFALAERQRLESLIQDAETELKTFQSDEPARRLISLSRAMLSPAPIHRLPSELLIQILLPCTCITLTPGFISIPPICIQAVCFRWRKLILSNKSVGWWSWLDIMPGNSDLSRSQQKILEKILERTGMAGSSKPLLDVTLNMKRLRFPYSDTSCLYSLIRKHSKKIERLTLPWSQPGCINMLKVSFPVLKSICLRIGRDKPSYFSTKRKPQMRAPSLTSVTLYEPLYHSGEPALDLPWEQLKHLTLYDHPGEVLSIILARCKELQVFEVIDSCLVQYGMMPEVPISLNSLHTLSMIHSDSLRMGVLFQHLTLPSLTTLCIHPGEHGPGRTHDDLCLKWTDQLHDHFWSCMARSRFRLSELSLEEINISYGNLFGLLSGLPTLQRLKLVERGRRRDSAGYKKEDAWITDEVIAGLTATDRAQSADTDAAAALLPALESLDLEGRCRASHFSLSNVIEMARSRWHRDGEQGPRTWTVICLKTVRVRMREQKVEDTAEVEELQRLGMKIVITG
jgi:hypothetical protein